MDDRARAMQVDTDLVRQLAELLDSTQLTEIEVQDGDRRIRVARQLQAAIHSVGAAPPFAAQPPAAPARAEEPAAQPTAHADPLNHPGTIRSPMVGTAYLSPEPGGRPFVTVGTQVAEGDTLLIIEAMKVMNPITAPRAGRVAAILIADEQPVEYDQPLVIVE